ncbi:MAG: DedA family protein, partial [Rhodococcus sp.]|nr:DedA family protein [Rhodococcus sp. (in: high G+C Gram-positive bacteria)]
WHYVENYASVFQYIVIGIVVALIAWFVVKKMKSRRVEVR